jgi:hypothetical protein
MNFRRLNVRRLSTLLTATALALGSPLAAPTAHAAQQKPGPWSDFRTADFDLAAGTRCPFELSGTVVRDKERIRTLETFPDGSPRVQEVVGPLFVRYTNVDTGKSVVRNLTGTGIFESFADGSSTLSLEGGHFATGLQPTDPGGPAFLVFTGHGYAVHFAADGTRTVTNGHGSVENICETLA